MLLRLQQTTTNTKSPSINRSKEQTSSGFYESTASPSPKSSDSTISSIAFTTNIKPSKIESSL